VGTFLLVPFLISLSHTLGHLENSWNTLALDQGKKRKDKEGKAKQISRNEEQDQMTPSGLHTCTNFHV